MLKYISILTVVGLLFAILFGIADKYLRKIKDPKKRQYAKIAIYAVLFLLMGIISGETVDYFR